MGDFSRAAKKVSRLKRELRDTHEHATDDAMDDLQTAVRNNLASNDSIARHVLITDVPRGEAIGYDEFVREWVTLPGWSKFLEHGTGARGTTDTQPDHRQYDGPSPLPPLEPIETWVTMKHVTSGYYDTPEDLARAIQHTIGEIGTFPHPFYRPAWHGPHGYRNVIEANERAMSVALRRSF